MAADAGVEPGRLREALAAFQGVKRRLEVRGEVGGVTVYDDFAHHPTAVAATLAALRGGPGTAGGWWPSSSRARTPPAPASSRTTSPGRSPWPTACYVAAAHLPGKVPEAQRLSEADARVGDRAAGWATPVFLPTVEGIVSALAAELRPGDRVAILSNGGFGGIHEKLLQALAEAPEASFRPTTVPAAV